MNDTPRVIESAYVVLADDPMGTASRRWWLRPRIIFATLATLLAVFALYVVFVVIPARIASSANGDQPQAGTTSITPAAPIGRSDPAPLSPPAPFAATRGEAGERFARETLNRIVERQQQLDDRRVDLWAPTAMAQARAMAEQGDALFLAGDYSAARATYEDALARHDELRQQLETLRTSKTEAIIQGLDNGNAADTDSALKLMEAVYPDDPLFKGLRARLAVMAATLEQMDSARLAFRNGNLDEARTGYEQAQAMDPGREAIAPALAEVNAAIAERQFRAALGRGFSAIAAGQFGLADEAFRQAASLRPDAPEVIEGRRQLADQRTLERIRQLHDQAADHVNAGRWPQARKAYQQALEIDDSLVFAREGMRFIDAREAMELQLQRFLQDPPMLSDDAALAAASSALRQAMAMVSPGGRITYLTNELAELLAVASQPLAVTLESDQATLVTIARVARLGSFARHQLDLRPGRYVLLGHRIGYRDVRTEVIVGPANTQFSIRCDEPI